MRHLQNKKQTAWKKSRTFGDLKGGRMRVKLKDNILRRLHSLQRPSTLDECPIYMQENPSRDFYFPITVDDIKSVLEQLPHEDIAPLTHIWLRKTKPNNKEQGYFVVGSGVYAIVLYPFPKNNRLIIGKKKPTNRQLTWYKGYAAVPQKEKDDWFFEFTNESARRYYLERLLMYEIGLCVNVHLVRSRTNRQKSDNSAEEYAYNMKIVISNFQ
ncbi:hypothetical protein [Bacteroides sp.]